MTIFKVDCIVSTSKRNIGRIKMSLRCVSSNHINYAIGFKYELTKATTGAFRGAAAIMGIYTWFFLDPVTLEATNRFGKVVATFEKVEEGK